MLRLQLHQQPHRFVKLSFATVTVGRDESNDLVIDAPTVSDFHAEITCQAHRYYIVDLLSAGGTFVNGQCISGRCELKSWDLVRLGKVELEVADSNKCRPGDWALRPQSSQLASQFYPLKAITVVGRDPDCDIAIDNNMLSRCHARLVIDEHQLRVIDLNSANGTFVNGRRITEARARPGDELRFDEEAFIILGPRGSEQPRQVVDDDHTVIRASVPEAQSEAAKVHLVPAPPDAEANRVMPPVADAASNHVVLPPAASDKTRFAPPPGESDKSRFAPPVGESDETRFVPTAGESDETRFVPPPGDADETRFVPPPADDDATRLLRARAARPPGTDTETTVPLPKKSRRLQPPAWLYGGLVLAAAIIGALGMYFWRSR
ncbi:FHA domain-containing protein [Sedimenticola sp.]|uniref:FHA domain-containing protein n=1 Tax=Sedimenticola sp. TaxID=1940285 RepID=UPI003D146FB7